MEKDYQNLSATVSDVTSDIQYLHCEVTEGREETTRVTTSVDSMKQEISQLKSEVDRLEEYSRRENLRLFGIPQRGQYEDNDTCVSAVLDTLNGIEGQTNTWTPDAIVRAHRIGQSREGGPRPMIVRFTRWRDKMAIIGNTDFRGKLKEKGVRVANDLTRTQSSVVAQARKEGKIAYFSRGKMVIGPKLPDPRTYAQVASKGVANVLHVADDMPTTTEVTQARGQGQQVSANRSEGSPPRDVNGTPGSSGQQRGLADRSGNPQRLDVAASPGQHQRGTSQPAGTRGATHRDVSERSDSARAAQTSSTAGRQTGLHGYFKNQQSRKSPAVDSDSGRTLRDRKK